MTMLRSRQKHWESQKWILLSLVFLSFGIHKSSQHFRFCHRGVWHQYLEQDCPFGILFNEQLQTPCFYTVTSPEDNNRTVPRIWPTICDEPYLNKVENLSDVYSGDGFFLAQKNGEIRMVDFTSDFGNDTEKSVKIDDVISLQSCEDRCYRDIFEDTHSSPLYTSSSHETSDSLEAPHHVSRPKLSDSDVASVRDQTLRLGDYLFDQIATPEENPGPKLRIVDLFKRSIKIMGKACQHPFIPSNFLNRILYGFLFLVSDSGVGELEDISVEEFEEIMMGLQGCDEKQPDFRLEGTVCETNAIVKEVIKILGNGTEYTAPFQLTQHRSQLQKRVNPSSAEQDRQMFKQNSGFEQDGGGDGEGGGNNANNEFSTISSDGSGSTHGSGSFPYDELDVFTEAAWSAVQVTHATCFVNFKPNANMHHRYVSAMEQLFSGKIQDRWRNPTRLVNSEMWGTWFLADVDLTFTNLQACIRAAYLDSPFGMRLDRPIDPVRTPSLSDAAASFQQPDAAPAMEHPNPGKSKKGATHKRRKRQAVLGNDPESYWNTYESNGGIRYKLVDEVKCFQNPDDRDKAVELMKEQCKPVSNK